MAKKKKKDEDCEDECTCGTNSAVMEALKELDDEDWDDTEEGGFAEMPAGTYQCKIKSVALVLSKSKGKLQIKWEFEVMSPSKYKGRNFWKYRGLVEPEDRAWAKTELAKLGVDWPKKKKLAKTLSDLEGTYCEMVLKESGTEGDTFKNFVKAIDEDDIESGDDCCEEDKGKVKKRKKKDEDDCCEDCCDDCCDEPKKKKKKKEDDDCCDDCCDCCEDDDCCAKPKKKGKKDCDDCDDDNEVTIKFKEDDLDKAQIKQIKKLAKKAGVDPDDYSDVIDLLGDVAEELKVSGTFKTPEKLFSALDDSEDCC